MDFCEQSVCGAILVDPACLNDIRENCSPEDFRTSWGKDLFTAACRMADSKELLDPVTIQKSTGLETKVLMDLMDLVPSAANAGEYAKELHKEALLARLSELANTIEEQALLPGVEPSDLAGQAMETLKNINNESTDVLRDTETSLERFLDYRAQLTSGEIKPVSTGYKSLDGILGGGMINKGLYILAARPGNCKTTLALKIAEHASETGDVLLVSLEMDDEQITARRIAEQTGLAIARLMNGELTEDEEAAVAVACGDLSEHHITINAKATATTSEISWWAQRLPDLRLIVIDYLGLIMPEGKHKSLYESVTEISNNLKRMARRLGVPVLCLAQVNRASEGRQGKRPTMADLRDSGAIEQDADAVLILHRPEKDLNKERWVGETLELYVDKNRHGETGKVTFDFYGANGKIIENGKF